MDETDIMDLTHQKARKRPRPISSADESVHASLKRLPMRAAECREPSLMFAVRGEPVPAASLKQNDHSVTSSPTTVMPAQVKRVKKKKKKSPGVVVVFRVWERDLFFFFISVSGSDCDFSHRHFGFCCVCVCVCVCVWIVFLWCGAHHCRVIWAPRTHFARVLRLNLNQFPSFFRGCSYLIEMLQTLVLPQPTSPSSCSTTTTTSSSSQPLSGSETFAAKN